MATKSVMAARFSIEKLVESSPRVWLWTFTFKELLEPKEAMKRWDVFTKRIKRHYPNVGGVRVAEWHPGTEWEGIGRLSHGLHIHLITNSDLDKDLLQKMKGSLFGHIHSIECKDRSDIGKLSGYLAKYLSKGYKQRHPLLKGARLWSNWANWNGVKVREVIYKSHFQIWFKELRLLLEFWASKGDECCEFDNIFCNFPPAEDMKQAFFNMVRSCQDDLKSNRYRYFKTAKLLYSQMSWEHLKDWNNIFGTMSLTD